MLYVRSRISFKVRIQKKIIALPCAKKKAHGKPWLCRVSQKSTRQSISLPCALVLPCVFLSTLGKIHVCRVPVNLHTANYGAHGKIEVSGSELCPTQIEVSGSELCPTLHPFLFFFRLFLRFHRAMLHGMTGRYV